MAHELENGYKIILFTTEAIIYETPEGETVRQDWLEITPEHPIVAHHPSFSIGVWCAHALSNKADQQVEQTHTCLSN